MAIIDEMRVAAHATRMRELKGLPYDEKEEEEQEEEKEEGKEKEKEKEKKGEGNSEVTKMAEAKQTNPKESPSYSSMSRSRMRGPPVASEALKQQTYNEDNDKESRKGYVFEDDIDEDDEDEDDASALSPKSTLPSPSRSPSSTSIPKKKNVKVRQDEGNGEVGSVEATVRAPGRSSAGINQLKQEKEVAMSNGLRSIINSRPVSDEVSLSFPVTYFIFFFCSMCIYNVVYFLCL